jgi:hypothetical protein
MVVSRTLLSRRHLRAAFKKWCIERVRVPQQPLPVGMFRNANERRVHFAGDIRPCGPTGCGAAACDQKKN